MRERGAECPRMRTRDKLPFGIDAQALLLHAAQPAAHERRVVALRQPSDAGRERTAEGALDTAIVSLTTGCDRHVRRAL